MSTMRKAGWLMAVGLAISPGAHAAKIGAGAVLAAGDFGDTLGGLQVGAWFGLPAVKRLRIGADVSWFPYQGATLFAIDPNVHFDLVQAPVLDVYAVGGVDVLYAHANVLGYSATDVDIGLLIGAGLEIKAGPLRPYAELRGAIHESAYVALSGGLRIAF